MSSKFEGNDSRYPEEVELDKMTKEITHLLNVVIEGVGYVTNSSVVYLLQCV